MKGAEMRWEISVRKSCFWRRSLKEIAILMYVESKDINEFDMS